MKILATLMLWAVALSGPLCAAPIWSYQFTESNPDAAFSIWHDGPIMPTGIDAFFAGPDLHSCTVGVRFYCEFVDFVVLGENLGVVFSRQGLDMEHVTPGQFVFMNARLDVPGTYTFPQGGDAWLKISTDPADLAPEPATWGMWGLGLVYAAWRSRSGRQSKADR